MLVWSEKLYISESLQRKSEAIKKKLSRSFFLPDVFLITAPTNEANVFDVFEAKELRFPYHRKREIVVYGLAKDKAEALSLVTTMLEEMYRKTGNFSGKEYFSEV